jgi:hypothetical protein
MRHFKPTRESFIPKGSIKLTPKGVDAAVYLYERDGRVYALAFGGRRNKPDFHNRFTNAQHRERVVREYIKNAMKVAAYKTEQAEKRRGFQHSYKVGDVLSCSWGYDQTNVEFYQVTATTPGTVTIREIAQDTVPDSQQAHGMSENRVARPGVFLEKSKAITKRPQYQKDGPGHVPMKHGCCSLWDGRPKYCSWYA